MQSPVKDHHKQARAWCNAWQQVKAGAPRSGGMSDTEREELVVSKLTELCTEEILWALNDDLVSRVFCNMWLIVDYKNCKAGWIGDANVLQAGIVRALNAKLGNPEADIVALIKTSVAEELVSRRNERIERLKSLKAKDILPGLLDRVNSNQHDNAAVFIDHLTGSQRSDLVALLHDKLTNEPSISIRMDQEPEEPHMWLFWYIYHSRLVQPEIRQSLGGIPRYFVAIRRGAVPKNRSGELVMPLAPMYAKVYDRQKREMNKLGLRPKNPGVKKIAESLGVDHAAITKYLKEDLPLELEPDGKGGLYYNFNTTTTINRCIEIIAGKKRGPKPKNI